MNPIFFAMFRFWWMAFSPDTSTKKPLVRDEPAE